MSKKIKFPLILKENQSVRTLEELRKFADVVKLYEYFINGKLVIWLLDRYYSTEAELIRKLNKDDSDILVKICNVLGVDVPEDIDKFNNDLKNNEQYVKKINALKQVVVDEAILSKVEDIAFDQKELEDIIKKRKNIIYLFNNNFYILEVAPESEFIGIGSNVNITVDDVDSLHKKKIKIHNAEIYCQGKSIVIEPKEPEYEYFIETCYDYDEGETDVHCLDDGTLYTTKYDGLFQRNKETGEKKLISEKKWCATEYICFNRGICYRIQETNDYRQSKVFYFDKKEKNIEIWKGEYSYQSLRYESNYVIWNAIEWRRGVSYFYDTIDLSLKKLDGRCATSSSGRVLLQGNCIYQNGCFSPINRFEIKTGKVYAIEITKPSSFGIYGDALYVEDNDRNFCKVSPKNWKPVVLTQSFACRSYHHLIAYVAFGNEFIWIVDDIGSKEIAIHVLDMQLHKIVNTIKYIRKTKVGGAMKVKMQGDFIYTNQTFCDYMEFKKVNKKTGEVVDISKEVFEEAPDVLSEENIVIFGKTK